MYSVVIVEDEELERNAVRKILQVNIAEIDIVGAATNGLEAVALIDRCDIDLMILDINIPCMSGVSVLRRLRERQAETKVIITTAYDYFDIAHSAIRLKADEFLLKPVRPSILLAAVQSCLDRLGKERRGREIALLLAGQAQRGDYRETIKLVRQYVERVCASDGRDAGPELMALGGVLLQIARENGCGRAARDAIAGQIGRIPEGVVDGDCGMALSALLRAIDALFGVETGLSPGAPQGDAIQKALDFIERNLGNGVTLDNAAEHSGISPCYLSRLFKKTMNMNFVTYLTNRRIECAKVMLADTDIPVSEIAAKLSYREVNYFCKSFRKIVGLSPLDFRHQASPSLDTAAGAEAA